MPYFQLNPPKIVSVDALLKRIRRVAMKHDLAFLRVAKYYRKYAGEYYFYNYDYVQVIEYVTNLEAYGRETGFLRPWEFLVEQNGEKSNG